MSFDYIHQSFLRVKIMALNPRFGGPEVLRDESEYGWSYKLTDARVEKNCLYETSTRIDSLDMGTLKIV